MLSGVSATLIKVNCGSSGAMNQSRSRFHSFDEQHRGHARAAGAVSSTHISQLALLSVASAEARRVSYLIVRFWCLFSLFPTPVKDNERNRALENSDKNTCKVLVIKYIVKLK